MNTKNELLSMEHIADSMQIDFARLRYPSNKALMSLESFYCGSTSIGTEGIISSIKEKAGKLMAKVSGGASKVFSVLNDNKYWVAGGLTVVAAFAVGAVALLKKGSDQKSDPKNIREKIKELAATVRKKIDELRKKNAPPQETDNAAKGKIASAVKKLIELVKAGKDRIFKGGKETDEKKDKPSMEGLTEYIQRHPVIGAFLIIFFSVPVILVLLVELLIKIIAKQDRSEEKK